MIHKYQGRALLIATGSCAIHCRYCFRREYPYGEDPKTLDQWEPAFAEIERDDSLQEILLSGGDPLMLTDRRLADLVARLEQIPHLKRLRLHSRLPIVLPSRVTEPLLELLTETRLRTILVVHANHPREVTGDCAEALKTLVQRGIPTLNQAVLLRDINDSVAVQQQLCEALINLGVLPYYLHQLDRVRGTSHFEVSEESGKAIVAALTERLPGYAVPRYVREIAGMSSKTPIA